MPGTLKPITRDDILRGEACPPQYEANLKTLLIKLNKLQTAYGKQLILNDGFRTMRMHIEIYRKKGITDPKKIPMKSKHLYCQAGDIDDDNKFTFYNWCQQNEPLMEELGLYFEIGTRGWVHCQIVPPASGKRWFIP